MKKEIKEKINGQLAELFEISKYLYANPELGYEEKKASAALIKYLSENGFSVEHPIYGVDTAFKAVCDSGKPGANIGIFCEYDALPEVGHGCGHDLIATIGAGAAVGLKTALGETGGKVTVFGTPAEESSGVKGVFGEQGAYKDITVGMMVHPNGKTIESGISLALKAIEFEYFGKTAHAAAAPEKGVNALDSAIFLFNGINALRQHVDKDVLMHGVIQNGGVVPNLVPDYAVARFYFRAPKKAVLDDVVERVKKLAEGAAMMSGSTLKMHYFENPYDDMVTNKTLSRTFNANLRELGETDIEAANDGVGSLDMGNVSHFIPAIHPWVGIGDDKLVLHTKEFADRTVTDKGKELLLRGACALAFTGYDVLTSSELQEEIKKEFESMKLNG
jgi:amidohydrolase